ncbi:MAG: hypothetical protein KAG96_03770 [Ichthyobacteriaceae bacterium]|nr:hypothetical protein [Ichthyobacteriaceae bacterium]
MYKYNSSVIVDGKTYSLKQFRNTKKIKRSRNMNLQYKMFVVNIDGIDVKLFLTRKGTNCKWHTILSTNTSLTFTKALKIYSTRWTI